jgi:DUF4097 and DUF4098 domain-containing protein YvlB
MEERMKILKMLEDGKITADEAAHLIEALGRSSGRPSPFGVESDIVGGMMDGVSNVIDSIPDMVRHTMPFVPARGKRTLTVKKKPVVRVSLVGGDLNLSASEDDNIRANLSAGIVRTSDMRDELWVKCVGGDANVQLPEIETLEISVVGGDIEGETNAPNLRIKSLDGDIELTLKAFKEAMFKTKSGDIAIELPETVDAQVDAYTMSGEIEFERDMEVEEETDNHMTGKIGEGTGKLVLRSLSGDISVS